MGGVGSRRLTEIFPPETHVQSGDAVSVKQALTMLHQMVEDLAATVEVQAQRINRLESYSKTKEEEE